MAASVLLLPEDLIVEILSWVSVKALMRFRCFSKAWNSLIFHPTLAKLHLQRSSKSTHIIVTYKDSWDGESALAPCSTRSLLENPSSIINGWNHLGYDDEYYFLGSCNGLVCFYLPLNDELTECMFQIWNPATRIVYKDLPPLQLNLCNSELREISMVRGFGYDDQSDTYKVLVMLMNTKSLKLEMKVHCLGDTCWRSISPCTAATISKHIDGRDISIIEQRNGRFVSDTLNWLAYWGISLTLSWENLTVRESELVVFSHDLNKETYKRLSIPDSRIENAELGVLKGCLCLTHHDHTKTHFVVWLKREFGVENFWTQLLNVRCEYLQQDNPVHWIAVRPICLSENDDVLLLPNYWNSEFVFYNLRDKRIDRTESFGSKFVWLPRLFSYDYVESLVLPYRN